MANEALKYLSQKIFWKDGDRDRKGMTIGQVLDQFTKKQGVACDGAINGIVWATSEAGDPSSSTKLRLTFETIGGSSCLILRDCDNAIRFQICGTLTSSSPSPSRSPSPSVSPSSSASVSVSPSSSSSLSPSSSVSPSSSSSASLSPSASVSRSSSASASPSASLSPSASVSPSSSSSLSASPSSSASPSVSPSPSA